MKHELKLVMTCDDNQPLTNHNTLLYVDDKVIGCIQQIDVHIDVDSILPQITVIFPDLRSADIDENYLSQPGSRALADSIDLDTEMLSQFPNVSVVKKSLFNYIDDTESLKEVGTDGIIDHITIKD